MVTVEPADEGDLCSPRSAERRRRLRGARPLRLWLDEGSGRALAPAGHPKDTCSSHSVPLDLHEKESKPEQRSREPAAAGGGGDKRQSTSHPRRWGRGCRVRCQVFRDRDEDWAGESRGGGKSGPEEEVRAASSAA